MMKSKINLPLRVKLYKLMWQIRFAIKPLTKRTLDIGVSVVVLVLISPILLIVAAMIKLESKGEVIFKQNRVGLNGVPFTMFKLRSMSCDAEERRTNLEASNETANGVIFKIRRDPRITRVGRIIRKTSIDELPQLLNVIKGDMSLVGPRPPLPNEVSQYSRADRLRLAVTPGITCIWQISGRSDIPFKQQVKLDIQYIEKQNLWFDLWVLLKTVPAVLKARGAY